VKRMAVALLQAGVAAIEAEGQEMGPIVARVGSAGKLFGDPARKPFTWSEKRGTMVSGASATWPVRPKVEFAAALAA
jgi:hypothetical protein